MRLTKFNPETGLYEYHETAKTQAEFNAQRKSVIQRLGEIEDKVERGGLAEVIRCKDCIYNHNGSCTHSEIYDDPNYNPDYYCADGERSENGT